MMAFHRNQKGSLEPRWRGGVLLYRAPFGYVTKNHGYSTKARKAMVFSGPGEAIRHAAVLGFAITRW